MRLSLILPTYNEAQNLPELLRRVHRQVQPFDIIVVDDDSPDGTWRIAEELQATYPHLCVIHRYGKKGLSSAVMEGCDRARGECIVVMDSDLQHDPSLVQELVRAIEDGADIAVASRYRDGGSVGAWVRGRRWLSRLGTFIARKLPQVETSDPMSGFFAVRADVYRAARPRMVPEGFKILFELLAAVPRGTRVAEVPLQFQPRLHGESKLSVLVQLQFLKQSLRIGLRKIGLTGPRVFTVIVLVLAVVFLRRIGDLWPLYTSTSLRAAVAVQVQDLAAVQGWLVSDVRIDRIAPDGSLVLTHQSHVRGRDPEDCWLLPSTGEPLPCAR